MPLRTNTIHHFLASHFVHFTCIPIVDDKIVRISNENYEKKDWIRIAAWGEGAGNSEAEQRTKNRCAPPGAYVEAVEEA